MLSGETGYATFKMHLSLKLWHLYLSAGRHYGGLPKHIHTSTELV